MIKREKRDKMIVKSAEKRYRSRIFLDTARAVLTLILRKYALYLHFYQLYFYLLFRQQCQQIAEGKPDGGGVIVRMNTDGGG